MVKSLKLIKLPSVCSLFLVIMLGVGTSLSFNTTALSAESEFEAGWEFYQQGKFSRAIKVWEPLAEEGHAEAQFNLSIMYEQGRGVDVDETRARYWSDKAVESEYPPALHNRALVMLAQKDYGAAIGLLRKSASGDFPPSQYSLGKIYQAGIGLEEDPTDAFKYIEMAANNGFAKAQYNLGKMYRDGYGVPVDEKTSAAWYLKAAEQGYSQAQNKISARYGIGEGVPQNDILALKWAILAAEGGIEGAVQKQDFFKSRMPQKDILTAEKLAEEFKPTM
ncbi:MAG: sel1 repeat family protein [Proteobacteria bacterium]|nr:sel1 repeat family protein [Pseudomonadota bacterium]